MAFNEVSIIKDVNEKPVPQYWNEEKGVFEVISSSGGQLKMVIHDSHGEEVLFKPLVSQIETKLDELIGVVEQIGI